MNNLIDTDVKTMSLKDITDLLETRHNDAMRIVEKMAESPEFGTITKISYSYKMPNNAVGKKETYALNKRQSVAVAARLNTALLMRVIDRWQELESQRFKLPNFEDPAEAAIAWAEQYKEKRFALEQLEAAKAQIENDKPAVSFANIVTDSTNARCIRVWVKSMKHENNLTVGEQQVFKWLLDNRYIFRDGGGYLPYAKYEANGQNYFTVTLDEINGKPRRVMKITGKGVVALTGKVVDAFSEMRNGLVLMQGGIK